jgi:uncharacterized protein
MSTNNIAYVELGCMQTEPMKHFYAQVFGWTFQDWGDDYATVEGSGLEAGFNADPATRPRTPLVILESAALEATLARVEQAGGAITQPIFAYPGGRRFHFRDPQGNELAVLEPNSARASS